MSEAVQQHYERLLARHYSWMFGASLEGKAGEQLALLKELGLGPRLTGLAIDLGCGSGFQTIALAELGAASVLAVDTSRALLDELLAHAAERSVKAIHGDLRKLKDLCEPGTAETIICMGDTLTHLGGEDDVGQLFVDAHAALQAGGALVLTYRDLSQPLDGLDRILPIRADDDCIMTCILDFHDKTVTVTDVIHRRENGGWIMEKSSYEKLRLAPRWIAEQLTHAGLRIDRNEPVGRLQAVVARKAG
jgi:SAM-dependent methyltransferase